MDIIYAAEKPSIARILSKHVNCRVAPAEINVMANPAETGSFLIRWQYDRYVLSPNGHLVEDILTLAE